MKLAVIGPVYPYRGGIAHHTTMVVRAMREAQHQVVTVSFRRQYPRWLYPGRTDRDPSRSPFQVEAEYLLDPVLPWTWWRTARYIAGLQPHLVVIQWWTTFWGPAFAVLAYMLRRRRIPTAFIIHNVFPHERRPWDSLLVPLALRRASFHIVQSEREKHRLSSVIPNASPVVSPHPKYDMFTHNRIGANEARKRLSLPEGDPVLLFFGIVRPYKGVRDLIRAVASLRHLGQRVFLLVAGELWEDRAEYERLIERLGLEEQVRLEDRYIPNEEVAAFFSAADLFVAPYTGGTQSGAMQIAVAFGMPIVATDIIAKDALIPDGIYVEQVPARSPDDLAKGILSALNHLHTSPNSAVNHTPTLLADWRPLIELLERMPSGAAAG